MPVTTWVTGKGGPSCYQPRSKCAILCFNTNKSLGLIFNPLVCFLTIWSCERWGVTIGKFFHSKVTKSIQVLRQDVTGKWRQSILDYGLQNLQNEDDGDNRINRWLALQYSTLESCVWIALKWRDTAVLHHFLLFY